MEDNRPPAESAEPELDTLSPSDPSGAAAPPSKKKRSRPFELFETVAVALLLAIFIRATVAEARFIPSGSMLPTLQIGDRLIVEKLSYYFQDPQRGDIVVFYPPSPGTPEMDMGGRVLRWLGFTREAAFIKRVVGMPGDKLEIRAGQVYINDQPLAEPYTMANSEEEKGLGFGSGIMDDLEAQTIPPKSYFMMGDNRDNSRDSRFWGTLPRENVIGRSFLRFWPVARFGLP